MKKEIEVAVNTVLENKYIEIEMENIIDDEYFLRLNIDNEILKELTEPISFVPYNLELWFEFSNLIHLLRFNDVINCSVEDENTLLIKINAKNFDNFDYEIGLDIYTNHKMLSNYTFNYYCEKLFSLIGIFNKNLIEITDAEIIKKIHGKSIKEEKYYKLNTNKVELYLKLNEYNMAYTIIIKDIEYSFIQKNKEFRGFFKNSNNKITPIQTDLIKTFINVLK